MYAILHIPTGTYLMYDHYSKETYKDADKCKVQDTLDSYFNHNIDPQALTTFIPGNLNEYVPIKNEFEVVEID